MADTNAYVTAYNEWHEKTQWVQDTAKPGELGKHRADVLRERIEKLTQENTLLKASYASEQTKVSSLERILVETTNALKDMVNEFRALDLPYGSKAYSKATAVLYGFKEKDKAASFDKLYEENAKLKAEIENLKSQIANHADELTVAHLDGRMRATQVTFNGLTEEETMAAASCIGLTTEPAGEPVAWRLTNTAFRNPKYEYFTHKSHAEVRQEDFNRSVDDGGLHDLTPIYTVPLPASQEDALNVTHKERCQHCIDRHDGVYGSWAAPCPYHDDDGKPRVAAPTTQPAPQQEATRVDPKTMELAESVGLIGPASRTNDLHAAIQRFHDLICVNATIKAAQMAAEVISKAAPQQEAAEDVDGHAFRTAARLGLTLRFYGGCAQSGMPGSPSAYEVCADRDRAAAMREAVARAEAVISRGGEAQRLEAPQQERVYLVATGETLNGRELYERHEKYVPLADCETLYTAPQPLPASQVDALSQAARDVLAERQRQIEVEGWTPEHDDKEHLPNELALAAASYVCADEGEAPPAIWPWDWSWWKPRDRRRNLVKSGALILAELERIDRLAARAAQERRQ